MKELGRRYFCGKRRRQECLQLKCDWKIRTGLCEQDLWQHRVLERVSKISNLTCQAMRRSAWKFSRTAWRVVRWTSWTGCSTYRTRRFSCMRIGWPPFRSSTLRCSTTKSSTRGVEAPPLALPVRIRRLEICSLDVVDGVLHLSNATFLMHENRLAA